MNVMKIEQLDDHRIKYNLSLNAPLNVVYHLWSHPSVARFLAGESDRLHSIKAQDLNKVIQTGQANSLTEVSLASDIKSSKLYAHFLQKKNTTIATITVDLRKPGSAVKLQDDTTLKAIRLRRELKKKISELETIN